MAIVVVVVVVTTEDKMYRELSGRSLAPDDDEHRRAGSRQADQKDQSEKSKEESGS